MRSACSGEGKNALSLAWTHCSARRRLAGDRSVQPAGDFLIRRAVTLAPFEMFDGGGVLLLTEQPLPQVATCLKVISIRFDGRMSRPIGTGSIAQFDRKITGLLPALRSLGVAKLACLFCKFVGQAGRDPAKSVCIG